MCSSVNVGQSRKLRKNKMVDFKEIIKKNKEIIKEIDLLDSEYCKNLKQIAKLQSDNVLMKSKSRKLRTQIKQFRVFRERRLTQEEKAKIIGETGKCEKCGSTDELTIHHKKKLSDGGTNKRGNLEVLCMNCHRKYHPINHIAIKHGEIKNDKTN